MTVQNDQRKTYEAPRPKSCRTSVLPRESNKSKAVLP